MLRVLQNSASRAPVPAAVIALALAVAGSFWPTLQSLTDEWRNTADLTYTHGYLIVAISAWLVVRARRSSWGPLAPDWRAVVLLVLLSLSWLIFYRAGIQLIHQALLPILMLVAVCAAFGVPNGSRFWFAFAYLYFAIPVWSVGNGMLQALTTYVVRLLLQVTGVPAYVMGNTVHIPAGVFEIANGCSGLHYFIVALALAALFGELHRDTLKARLQFVLWAALLALVTNWIRVYVIITAGHLSDMQHYLVRVDHYYFGWVLFAIAMTAFFWLAGRSPVRQQPTSPSGERPPSAERSRLIAGVVLSLAAASTGPLIERFVPRTATAQRQGPLLPSSIAGWNGPQQADDAWNPTYPRSDRSQIAQYDRGGRAVTAFVAEYDQQRQGKELIGFDNSIINGLAGVPQHSTAITLHAGDARLLRIAGADQKAIVVYYYRVGARHTISDFGAQIAYGLASLVSSTPSRVIAVHVQCAADCAAAVEDAKQFLDDLDATRALTAA